MDSTSVLVESSFMAEPLWLWREARAKATHGQKFKGIQFQAGFDGTLIEG
jgi:hypothetical protein